MCVMVPVCSYKTEQWHETWLNKETCKDFNIWKISWSLVTTFDWQISSGKRKAAFIVWLFHEQWHVTSGFNLKPLPTATKSHLKKIKETSVSLTQLVRGTPGHEGVLFKAHSESDRIDVQCKLISSWVMFPQLKIVDHFCTIKAVLPLTIHLTLVEFLSVLSTLC